MLGTGIASADEDVNPDRPASPLDGSVNVPVNLDNNVLGTPLGQKALPAYHKDVRVSPSELAGTAPVVQRTVPVVTKATGAAAPLAGKVQDTVSPITGQSRDQVAPLVVTTPVMDQAASLPAGEKLPKLPTMERIGLPRVDVASDDPATGNEVNADVVAPVDISGNAFAVAGPAETVNESEHSYGTDHDVVTEGNRGFVSGNVVDLDWALPVQVTNNAVAGLGDASAAGTNSQEAAATGDIVTDGGHSLVGGNVVAPQFATPVQMDGNAVAGVGEASAASEADTSAESGGTVLTSGTDSAGGGNAVPVPVAMPVKANGNAFMGLGRAFALADSTADANSGATRTGRYGVPTYVETTGDPALGAGNIAQPAASGPIALCGNSGGVAGTADATCDTATEAAAGGTSRTTGAASVLSGAVASAPVAMPVQGFGNAAAGVGEATTDANNTVDATSGGSSYTRGHDSVLSGTTANAPVAGPVDLFANSAAGAGDSTATALNDATATSGGHTGTTGDNSVVGGNSGAVPVVLPGEAFGNSAAGVGGANATGAETKKSTAGGGNNTADDNGLLASNLVTAPVATAAQAFGNGAGALAFTDARAQTDSALKAGGDNKATGTAGALSGNIGQAPVSVPAQLFGTGASGLANGTQTATNYTDMESGGDAMSDGAQSAGSGNVVSAPVAGAGHLYGESAAALGKNDALAGQQFATAAGGDTGTSGADGFGAGNVVSPQALPVAQSFAAVASGPGGVNSSSASNETQGESGGDIDTDGAGGFASGNLVDVPAAGVVQPFGDAAAVLGSKSAASATSDTTGHVGGTSTTGGDNGRLSGIDGTLPLGANVPVYAVPHEVLARAVAESANPGSLEVGESENHLFFPVSGPLEATELPSVMPRYQRTPPPPAPSDGFGGVFSGVLTGFAGGMTGLADQDRVPGVADTVANREMPRILPAPARTNVDPVGGMAGGVNDTTAQLGPVVGLLNGPARADVDPLSGLSGGLSDATDQLGPVRGLLNGPASGAVAPANGVAVGGSTPVDAVNRLMSRIQPAPARADVDRSNGANDVTDQLGPVTGRFDDPADGALAPANGVAVGGGGPLQAASGLLGGVNGGVGGNGITPAAGATSLGNLPVGQQRDLPVAGDLLGNLPLVGGLAGDDLPLVGGLTSGESPLSGLPVVGGLGQQRDLPVAGDLLGNLPLVGGLAGDDLPLVGGLTGDDLPLSGLPAVGDLGGLGQQRDLPVAGDLLGNLPLVGGLAGDDLPLVGGLTSGELPLAGLAGLGGFGGRSDVPDFPPAFGDLTDVTTVIPAVPAAPGLPATPAVPALPARDLGDTAVIPVIPATGDLTDVTAVIPAVPGFGDVNAVPVVQVPSVNTLPVSPQQLSGVRTPVSSGVHPHLDESSLDSTRAALAHLFTAHPMV